MKRSLQDALFATYPGLFRQRHLPPTESALGRGVECADGWYSILDGLCEMLSVHGRQIGHEPVEITQVKEKFAGLRVYLANDCAWCQGAVGLSGAFSLHICEVTGRSGIAMEKSRMVRTLAEDVGRANGYQPLVGRGDHTPEDNSHEYTALPAGWRTLARVLGTIASCDAPAASLRFRCEGGCLEIDGPATDQGLAGAIVCTSALARRLSPVTGAMRTPQPTSADEVDLSYRL